MSPRADHLNRSQLAASLAENERASAESFLRALERVAKADKDADEGSAMVAKAMRAGALEDPERVNLLLQRQRTEQEAARFALSVAQQAYAQAQTSRRELDISRQQRQLTAATWLLAAATIVLAIATIGLFIATLNMAA